MRNELGHVRPVAPAARQMTNWDMCATWIGANANNGTWYIGGVIAAAGMLTASTALVVCGLVSYVLLALASYMGYRTGLPAMALTRPAFGLRGSLVPSVINVVQFIGWAAANTFIAAISIATILHDLLGWPAYGTPGGHRGLIVGILVMSMLHMASIALGERSVRMIERVGIVLVMVFVVWESIVVFQHVSLGAIMAWRPATHLRLTGGAAIDVLAAFNLAWVTAAADFSRFTNKPHAATTWSFVGANIGLFWFAFIGLVATIATAITMNHFDPNDSDPSTIATKLGLGVLALLVIVITSTTANAVNLMAAGSAVTNMWHRMTLRPALWLVTGVATLVSFVPLFFATFLDAFTAFLDMIGMFLGPEIAVFLVDFFILRHRQYDAPAMNRPGGQYWYWHGVNWRALGAWALGVLGYFACRRVPMIADHVGATFVAMAGTACVYRVLSRRQQSK